MSKIRTAYRVGMKAYKLGKKTRQANAGKRAALKSLKSAKSSYSDARKLISKSKTQLGIGAREGVKGALGKKGAIQKSKVAFKVAKTNAVRAGWRQQAADAQVKVSKSLSAQYRATKKISTKGLGTRAAFAAGRVRKRTVAATAGVGFGINSFRGKKRKPMSAATKAKISKALKGRKRK